MTEKNLGMCFAPSLFHLFGSKDDPSAPKRQKRTQMSKASKELTDNLVRAQFIMHFTGTSFDYNSVSFSFCANKSGAWNLCLLRVLIRSGHLFSV